MDLHMVKVELTEMQSEFLIALLHESSREYLSNVYNSHWQQVKDMVAIDKAISEGMRAQAHALWKRAIGEEIEEEAEREEQQELSSALEKLIRTIKEEQEISFRDAVEEALRRFREEQAATTAPETAGELVSDTTEFDAAIEEEAEPEYPAEPEEAEEAAPEATEEEESAAQEVPEATKAAAPEPVPEEAKPEPKWIMDKASVTVAVHPSFSRFFREKAETEKAASLSVLARKCLEKALENGGDPELLKLDNPPIFKGARSEALSFYLPKELLITLKEYERESDRARSAVIYSILENTFRAEVLEKEAGSDNLFDPVKEKEALDEAERLAIRREKNEIFERLTNYRKSHPKCTYKSLAAYGLKTEDVFAMLSGNKRDIGKWRSLNRRLNDLEKLDEKKA